ncbi:hypothetical protein BD310DRAFT_802046, partial [Dichomitus squalens]
LIHMRYIKRISTEEIHDCTGVKARTIQRILNLFNKTATVSPQGPSRIYESCLTQENMKFFEGHIEHSPDAYLDELKIHLEDACGKRVSKTSVWRALRKMGFTLKKVR